MSRSQRPRNGQRRRSPASVTNSDNVWRIPGELPPVERISVSNDVTALVRSLGEPPMNGATEASIQFGTVTERSAAIAAALALSADLLDGSLY